MSDPNESPTLHEAQALVDTWIKTYGVRYFSELTNMACLTEEVGELARIIARYSLGTPLFGQPDGHRPQRSLSPQP